MGMGNDTGFRSSGGLVNGTIVWNHEENGITRWVRNEDEVARSCDGTYTLDLDPSLVITVNSMVATFSDGQEMMIRREGETLCLDMPGHGDTGFKTCGLEDGTMVWCHEQLGIRRWVRRQE